MVSRLTTQKGLDLLLGALPRLLAGRGQLALIGSGDADIEQGFVAAAGAHRGAVAVRIEATMRAWRTGLCRARRRDCRAVAVRAVRADANVRSCVRDAAAGAAVGGLADTVRDASAGRRQRILVRAGTSGAPWRRRSTPGCFLPLAGASGPRRRCRRRGDERGFPSWEPSARRYRELYRELLRPEGLMELELHGMVIAPENINLSRGAIDSMAWTHKSR